jgi:acetate kinase
MGFTGPDALPMGIRCSELDTGAVLHLIQRKGMCEPWASEDPRAHFAVELLCYRVFRHIGSLVAALGRA